MEARRKNEFDVVIAGGGVAGIAVTAALTEFGYRILIIEPGVDHSRRLAGELIHPPGVTDLRLGLLEPMKSCGGVPVRGFAVFPDSNRQRAFRLGYADVPGLLNEGYSVAHGPLADRLLREVEQLPLVTVWKGARVVGVATEAQRSISVVVRGPDGETQIAPQMLVAADGANSQVRRMAGIPVDCRRVSQMMSYSISSDHLPASGFGNVFLGAPAPVLAYQIATGTIRVMFDLPVETSATNLVATLTPHLEALPEPFRADVRQAIETQKPLSAMTYSVVPKTVYKGRILCVGDAAGCCHPLSATGLSVCTRDAIRLRDSIKAANGDLDVALREHARRRRRPQRTRAAVASILYDAFSARTSHMRLLRTGMLRYWARSAQGRASSMALLSLSEERMTCMAREYSVASWFAFRELCRSGWTGGSIKSAPVAILGLSISMVECVAEALKEMIL
jgi:2-polyprenyl-6-methoxyphenol hydroxylase-like FAD-dependent oxidoreductase